MFSQLKETFLNDTLPTVEMKEIPAELILNLDQMGIKIIPSSTWIMERKGCKCVEAVGVNDKQLITAVLRITYERFSTSTDNLQRQDTKMSFALPVSTRLAHYSVWNALHGPMRRPCLIMSPKSSSLTWNPFHNVLRKTHQDLSSWTNLRARLSVQWLIHWTQTTVIIHVCHCR